MRSFEESCSLGRGNISNMSEIGSIGSDKLTKIIDAYQDVDPIWLLTGEGEMLKSLDPPISQPQKRHSIENNSTQQPLEGMLTYLQAENKELKTENKELKAEINSLNKQIGGLGGELKGKDEVISIFKEELHLLKKDFPTPSARGARRAV